MLGRGRCADANRGLGEVVNDNEAKRRPRLGTPPDQGETNDFIASLATRVEPREKKGMR